MNQVKQVLKNLKAHYRFNFRSDLFYVLIRSCYYHSSFKVCDAIFQQMMQLEAMIDNRIKLMHFDHRSQAIKKAGARMNEGKGASEDPRLQKSSSNPMSGTSPFEKKLSFNSQSNR